MIIPDLFTKTPYQMTNTKPFANVVFYKSPTTTTYTRSFNKIDSFFSYVGGIVGTIITVMFLSKFYT